MKYIFYNLYIPLFSLLAFSVKSNEIECFNSITINPPFFVSETYKQGDKIFENLRTISGKKKKYSLPKGSIVHVDFEILRQANKSNYLPVEVISTPQKSNDLHIFNKEEKNNRFNYLMNGSKQLKPADIGTKGYLRKKSLRKAGKYRFIVTQNTRLYDRVNPDQMPNINLKLQMNNSKTYKIKLCSFLNKQTHQKQFFKKYIYDVYSNNQKISETNINQLSCNFSNSITPIETSIFDIFDQITLTLNINYGDLISLPGNDDNTTNQRQNMIKLPIQEMANASHFKPDDSRSNDLFALPSVICALSKALKEFSTKCDVVGCQVQIGDLFHKKKWGVHESHQSGKCVDIRPLRKNDNDDYGLIVDDNRYDREKTCMLLRTLQKYGASYILFGDTKCNGVWAQKGEKMPTHMNHLHVCFNSIKRNKMVCNDY